MCNYSPDCDLPAINSFGIDCCQRCFAWFWTEEDEKKYLERKIINNPVLLKQKLDEYRLKEVYRKNRLEEEEIELNRKLNNGYVLLENGLVYYEKDILEGKTGLNGTLWNSGYRPDDLRRITWHKKREDEL